VNNDFRVGPWLVQPSLNTISQNGTSNRLEPKVMGVLVCLADQAGEVVAKEKLLQTVWPDTFVSDDVLKRSVSELRRVFEDDPRESRIIETIPKRGYRLMTDVKPSNSHISVGLAKAPVIKGDPASARPAIRRWTIALAMLGVVASVGGLLLALNVDGIRERVFGRTGPQIRSLAILPLQNLSGDPSQDYFADGMTEELITQLSRLSSLRVISRTSVMRYKNSNKPLPEIARELGVEGIIEGSVLRSGDRVRITAQLIYAAQDKNIWAQSYDRDLQDVLALQSTVATTIADEIRVKMTPGEQAQLGSFRPVNLKAHEAYLRGLYRLQQAQDATYKKDKGKLVENEAQKAVGYFQEAIQADPNYAPAYTGVSDAWLSGQLPLRDWAPRAKSMVLKALQLDDNLASAHRMMGDLLRCEDWDWTGAEREYRRAIQLEPSNMDAHTNYSYLLFNTGRMQEGMKEVEVAQSLDPRSDSMASAFYATRQFDRAIDLDHAQAQIRPSDFYPHFELSNIYALTGRHREAISELQAMDTVLEYRELAAALGRTYESAGYEKALQMYAARLQVYARKAYIPDWYIASIYGFLGDKGQAFAWLEKAYKARDGMEGLADPMWDPLRSDPRFKDLVRRVGLPAVVAELGGLPSHDSESQ
jgi:TolB-like protein/DNA-binding winged helix-turn-helix (wHTH) protein/Tfp pilus assembly protein PilF